jgi:hypothetical protein
MNYKFITTVLDRLFALLIVSTCILVIAFGSYWSFVQPSDILSDIGQHPVVNHGVSNKVEAGKGMIVTRAFCINQHNVPGVVTRSFNNHIVYQLPNVSTKRLSREPLGCSEKDYLVDIPAALPTDDYEYRVEITYQVNPIKTVNYQLPPVKIHVINPVWDAAKSLVKE